MVLELVFGIGILFVVSYIIFRVIGNIAFGVALIAGIFVASYLLVGAVPNLGNVPVLGAFIPKTGNAIAIVKDYAYSMDMLGVSNSSQGNIIVTAVNTGKLELKEFAASVDGQNASILNNIDSLKSGNVYAFEIDWKDSYSRVTINAYNAQASYNKPS